MYLNAPVARTSAADEFQLLEIANGNFVHIGHFPPLNSQNQGDIANIGFIVGEKCIAVIDTGSSIAVGQKLKAAIGRVSKLPICAVVITHVHPDHLLGLNAFGSDPGIVFYGHHRLPRQIKARYRYYLESVRQELNLGEPEKYLIDNEIFKTIKNTVRIDLGNRILEIKAWGHAHTDHDLTIMDKKTETFWAGDIVTSEHVPILDSNARGYLEVTKRLKELNPKKYVVGHGDFKRPWGEVIAAQEEYITVLIDETRLALKNNVSLMDAVNVIGWGERHKWRNFDRYHRRNVTTTYTDLEWED